MRPAGCPPPTSGQTRAGDLAFALRQEGLVIARIDGEQLLSFVDEAAGHSGRIDAYDHARDFGFSVISRAGTDRPIAVISAR